MIDIIKKLFGTSDLYEILKITSKDAADEKKLRSSYLRAALRFHPDKSKDEESTEKFQVMKKIYDLLKDDDLRKSYDETGDWPEEGDCVLDVASFGKLDQNAILEFKKMYIGSEEEQNDIIRFYNEGEGDIFHIVDNLFFANILTDEARIEAIINDLLENKKMERKSKGAVTQKQRDRRIKKAQKEAKEAEEALKELGIGDSMDSLHQAIAKRGAQRMDNLIDNLEKKYGAAEKSKINKRKGSKAKSDDATPSKKSKQAESSGSKSKSKGSKSTTKSHK